MNLLGSLVLSFTDRNGRVQICSEGTDKPKIKVCFSVLLQVLMSAELADTQPGAEVGCFVLVGWLLYFFP